MNDRLAITVAHADGRTTRWGPGEVDAGRIPNDLSFSSSSPGGFKELSTSLLRDIQPQADEGLLDTVTVYGPGGQVAWEGRIQQLPRETGDANRMSPQAVGWSSHLEDKKSARMVFVDRDMGRWAGPSLARRIAVATGGGFLDGVTVNDLTWDVPDSLPALDTTERVYTMPVGIKASKIMYRGARNGAFTSFEVPTLYASDNADLSSADSYTLTLDDTLRTQTLTTPRRYLMLRTFAGSAVTPAAGHQQRYTKLAVYGNNGLSTQAISGEPSGIYLSDLVGYMVATYAPLLNTSTANVQSNTYVVPQASYPDLTTAAAMVADVNKYAGWDWLVYDNKTFYYQPAGSGVEWRGRRADGAKLRLDGESSDVIVNAMYVQYTDGFGNQRIAGPPGSGVDVTDATLQDTSATHPVNSHGIAEKSEILNLSQPTTDAGAVVIGALALYEKNIATRRGQITLTGKVEHPTEGKVPVWRVRAGDSIIVSDLLGDVSRRIIQADYQHGTTTATLTLDNTPPVTEAILERLVVGLGGIR